MDHFNLISYKVQNAGSNNIVVLVKGNREYKRILSRAFPKHFLSRAFDDRYMHFDWGTYVYDVSAYITREVEDLLKLCKQHVFLDDDLTECFALDYHTAPDPSSGNHPRTNIGKLVYQAKPYNRKPSNRNFEAAHNLAKQMISFIQNHPTYGRSEVVVAAPPSRSDKPFDLPSELVQHILVAYDTMVDGNGWIKKVRPTRPMKDCHTIPDKINNVRNAFAVTGNGNVEERTVLLIDDIYQSGFTLNEVVRVLFEAGAKSVLGLVATKTGRDV